MESILKLCMYPVFTADIYMYNKGYEDIEVCGSYCHNLNVRQ